MEGGEAWAGSQESGEGEGSLAGVMNEGRELC